MCNTHHRKQPDKTQDQQKGVGNVLQSSLKNTQRTWHQNRRQREATMGGGHPPRSHHMARMPARPSVHGPLTDNTIGKMSALPEGWSSIVCLHGGMIVERSEGHGKVLLRGATRSS